MDGQKSAAKWLAIILLVSISIFSYAMYDSFFVSSSGQVQGETPNETGDEIPPNTTPDPPPIDIPVVVPVIEYSTFPRQASVFGTTTVQHTGGYSEEVLLRSHILSNQTFAILKTASNSFDYKAENHLAIALFEKETLQSTFVFSELNETYLDSKITSDGLVVLSKTQNNVCKLRLFSTTLLLKNEATMDTDGQVVLSASLYLDESELILFATTIDKLICKIISPSLVLANYCASYDISSGTVVSVQKIIDHFVLGLNSTLLQNCDTHIVSLSQNNGFQLEKKFENQIAISFNVAVEQQVPYFILTSKVGSAICLKKLSVTYQTLFSTTIDSTTSAMVTQLETGYVAITENAVYYLCRHLDAFCKQNLCELGIGNENDFTQVKTLLKFGNKNYAILYSATAHKASLVAIENFGVSLVFSFGAEDSEISLFTTPNCAQLVFTTALREGIFINNFGGKDVYHVALDLTAEK